MTSNIFFVSAVQKDIQFNVRQQILTFKRHKPKTKIEIQQFINYQKYLIILTFHQLTQL